MQTLINPKIVIQQSTKKGKYKITIMLCRKNLNELTIRARSHNGKDNRILGAFSRDGILILKKNKYARLMPFINQHYNDKIQFLLDLLYGIKRTNQPTINKDGYAQFTK